MASKGGLVLWCHVCVWAAAALALWAGGANADVRYDTATPYAPPYNNYKYIPLQWVLNISYIHVLLLKQ